MLTVAIGAENDSYDAEVYRVLTQRILGCEIERHRTQLVFSGWRSVTSLAEAYLRDAADKGVRHALFAIDNDGGAKRAPEHDDAHDANAEAASDDGCRVCWLEQALPAWWTSDARRGCLVVPVQTLETWLLCLRGHRFETKSPEQTYPRRELKKLFHGHPQPPVEVRLESALQEIGGPDALDVLHERRSFRHFEAQLATWR